MPYKDSSKRKEYNRVYQARYLADPERRAAHLSKVGARRKRMKEQCAALYAQFKASGCAICSESLPVCLDAHHINPADKLFHVSSYSDNRHTPEQIKEELAKCACLCANCHRKLHAGIVELK